MATQNRVLFVGLPKAQALRFEDALTNHAIAMEVESSPASACSRLHEERFNAVIATYPLPTGDLGRIITAVRSRAAGSVGAGLLLLAEVNSLRAANGLKGRGIYRVMSVEVKPVLLAIMVQQTIEYVQPMTERLPIQLPVVLKIGDKEHTWRTENLCGRGMLVVTDSPSEIGTHFDFTLSLPNEPIRGRALVVRRVDTSSESVQGFGARFWSFEGDGRSRLLAYLRGAAGSYRSTQEPEVTTE
jgi:hypothetical protein